MRFGAPGPKQSWPSRVTDPSRMTGNQLTRKTEIKVIAAHAVWTWLRQA
jgi:hypothetical protein